MTVQFSVTFSSLFVEYEYFVAFYQRRNYFTNYFSTINSRSTYSYCSIVVYQQYFFKFNSCAVFCVLNENIRLTVDMEVSVCLAK